MPRPRPRPPPDPACPPAAPVFLGLATGDETTAVRSAPSSDRTDGSALRIVAEVAPGEGGEPRYDVPLSFTEGARRYGLRYVRTEWFLPPPPPLAEPGTDRARAAR